MFSFIIPSNAPYQIHINSRDTTPTCFGKIYYRQVVLIPRLKPTIYGGNITKFRNLWYDLQFVLIVYKMYVCGLKYYY
jgi:hypothetical protein